MTTAATNYTTITADVPDYASGTIKFVLLSSIAISGAEVFPGKIYAMTLDVNGVGSTDIPTPDGDGTLAWLWDIELPDGRKQQVPITWAAISQDIATILAAAVSTTTPSDIAQLITNKVSRTGDTMTGALVLSGAPTIDLHAATKKYVDDNSGGGGDVDDLTTTTGNTTEMLRVDGAGTGLEYRTAAQVLSDIGAETAGAAATVAGNLTSHENETTTAHGNILPEDAGIVSVSSGRDLATTDAGKILECTGTFTLNCPNGLDAGFQVALCNVGAGIITISATTTLTAKGAAYTLADQYAMGTLYHRSSNVWRLAGDLT